jgi:hypothetical protein
MAKFMYVFRGGGYAGGTLSPSELQQHLAKWNDWAQGLRAAGRLAAEQPLSYPPTGKTVRGREKIVTDGPYAESKDLVSGILVVEAASLDEAAELARGCPILDLDGSVEVRSALVVPGK